MTHELGLKGPFQNLLDKAAKKRGWTLVAELSTYSGGIFPPGKHPGSIRWLHCDRIERKEMSGFVRRFSRALGR